MRVHLVDGTYELFRHFFAMPSRRNARGEEVAATRGVVVSMLNMLRDGATHVAVATDKVIESFRNRLWPGYKGGEGIDPDLLAQFPLLEDAIQAMGITVWAMVEFEADDALAAGAKLASADERVDEVLICTPDKDLAQCVEGRRVVQFDRRQQKRFDEDAVWEKFGVGPESIPDYLALVGDSADGFPGLKGWGAKSSSTVLAEYTHLEAIPTHESDWGVKVRAAAKLAAVLREERELAVLFRHIATVVRDAPISPSVDDLAWQGPLPEFAEISTRLGAPDLHRQAVAAASSQARAYG